VLEVTQHDLRPQAPQRYADANALVRAAWRQGYSWGWLSRDTLEVGYNDLERDDWAATYQVPPGLVLPPPAGTYICPLLHIEQWTRRATRRWPQKPDAATAGTVAAS